MAKVLKFKDVSSDVDSRLKEFEKMRTKYKADQKKGEAKKASAGKEGTGLLKSISNFFADTPKSTANSGLKK